MTPKEKAEELVERLYGCAGYALIAVDEIINTASPVYDSFWPMNTKDYWQEVKQEIGKL